MISAVCTLFEGDYHYGVAALVNSLYMHGFRGSVWAGYRGQLPPWAKPLVQENNWSLYQVADGLDIRFVPLTTKHHLTNYKPDFMLDLWEHYCPKAEAIFYFDPDIVIRCQWSYFETWARGGVALCEDINSPLLRTHPLRFQWNEVYSKHGYPLRFTLDEYINGGFQGITHSHKEFLNEWLLVQRIMGEEIGGLRKVTIDIGGRENAFSKTDQDALNITLALTQQPLSIIGKEGMDIVGGGFTMSHSIGHRKPWNTNFLAESIAGHPPSLASKNYFYYVKSPICAHAPQRLRQTRLSLSIASAIGRFYRRG
jgi:hypothetical protein